eukprot:m.1535650 g.1535650  ORF g.1535650 m.1535650 type:complete len:66 (-) comp25243_c0_seq79:6069-6266(-)
MSVSSSAPVAFNLKLGSSWAHRTTPVSGTAVGSHGGLMWAWPSAGAPFAETLVHISINKLQLPCQ